VITILVPIPSLLFPWEQLDQPAQFVCIASACTPSTPPEKKKKPLCVLGNELFIKLRCSRWMILFFKKPLWQKKKTKLDGDKHVLILIAFILTVFTLRSSFFFQSEKNPCKRKKKAKNSVISRYTLETCTLFSPFCPFLTLFV